MVHGWSTSRLLVVGAVVAATLALTTGSTVGQAEPLRFQGDGSDVELTEDTTVTLVSNVDQAVEATLTVTLLGVVDAEGDPVDGTSVVLVPPAVTIAAGQRAEVPVAVAGLASLDLPDDGIRGHLDATAGDATARWSFVLKGTAPAAKAATTAVTTWTVTLGGTAAGEDEGVLLPLETGGTIENPVGTIQRSDGDPVTVTATETTVDDRPYAELEFEGLETGYTYEGTIDLDPDDDEAGSIELEASRTDGIWVAVWWMILGLLAAVLVKYLGSVALPLWKLDRERRAAARRARRADAEMVSPDEPFDDVEIWVCVSAMATDARAKAEIEKLWRRVTLAIDVEDPHHEAAVEAIEELQRSEAWGLEARKELHALKLELAKPRPNPPLAPPPGTAEPYPLWEACEKHLEDRQIALDEIADTRATTRWLTEMVEGRTPMLEGMAQRAVILESLGELPLSWRDRELLQAATRDLAAARWHHWHATSADDLAEGKVEERLASVDDAIAQLSGRAPEGMDLRPAAAAGGLVAAPAALAGLSAIDLPELVAKVTAPLRRVGATALTGVAGLVVLVFAAATSIALALATVYTEPFGNPQQLVAAFAWGAGTVAVLQVVESSVDTVFGRREKTSPEAEDGDAA